MRCSRAITRSRSRRIVDFGFWIFDFGLPILDWSAPANPKSKVQNPKSFWIADFGLERASKSKIQSPKSKIGIGTPMKLTDLFIKRPVLAMVVNLVILIAGLQSIRSLSVRQFPRSDMANVVVTTAYVGANA